MDKTLNSLTLGQYDARFTVTFPVARHHSLAQGRYWLGVGCKPDTLTLTPPGHAV